MPYLLIMKISRKMYFLKIFKIDFLSFLVNYIIEGPPWGPPWGPFSRIFFVRGFAAKILFRLNDRGGPMGPQIFDLHVLYT